MHVGGGKALGLENLLRLDTASFKEVTKESRTGFVFFSLFVSFSSGFLHGGHVHGGHVTHNPS